MIVLPNRLVEAIRNNEAVAFVGAGLSMSAGVPSWDELLGRLLARVRDSDCSKAMRRAMATLIKEGRIPDAANLLIKELGRKRIVAEIRDMLAHVSPGEAQRLLVQLKFSVIFTTNWDTLLEQAVHGKARSFTQTTFNSAAPLEPGKRFFLHLHGDVEHPEDVVFSEPDYRSVFESQAKTYLQAMLTTKTALWLGFGHKDDDVRSALAGAGLGRFMGGFQVVERREKALIGTLESQGIEPIEVDNYKNDLPRFLGALLKKTAQDAPPKSRGRASHPPRLRKEDRQSRDITHAFTDSPIRRLKAIHDLVDPVIRAYGRSTRLAAEVFADWARERRMVLVAPPAVGKTVILRRFAKWVRENSDSLPQQTPLPIILYVTPDSIPEAITHERKLWDQICRRADLETAGYCDIDRTGLLNRWLDAGAVYLLFDGLDEFGARRQGELECLLGELRDLVDGRGVRAFLTCREVFWNHQVKDLPRAFWSRVDVDPLDAKEIEKLIPYPGLGSFAYDAQKKIKRGLLNHLLLGFIVAMRSPGAKVQPFRSRYDLYDRWAQTTVARAPVHHDNWLQLFDKTAVALVEALQLSVPFLNVDVGIPFHECLASGVLEASTDGTKVKFCHESFNEFFLSRALVGDFKKLVEPNASAKELAGRPLTRVDLDFLQPSIYGFLYDQLGKSFPMDLLQRHAATDAFGYNAETVKLRRNLVEYVGMTWADSVDLPLVTTWLLSLMAEPRVDSVVRYNAARALERIHPWAPQPYFDFMSDWGDQDWGKVDDQASRDKIGPWAIRGYRFAKRTGEASGSDIIERKPGTLPFLAVVRNRALDMDLQISVSKALAGLVEGLLQGIPKSSRHRSAARDLEWLLINYTFAWTRWYHPKQGEALRRIRSLARAKKVGKEILENLEIWVAHAKLSPHGKAGEVAA